MNTEKPKYTHEERVKFAQRAVEEYYEKETGGPPPLNRDFMKMDEVSGKKRSRIMRYSAIAAVVLVVILVGSTISMFTSNNDAYGDKGLLYRIYHSIKGLGTDQQDDIPENEPLESIETTSIENIGTAIDFVDDGILYVPEYVPKRYQLETILIQNKGDDTYDATYKFRNGKDTLSVIEMYIDRDDQVSANGEGDMIKLKDRVIYVREPDTNDNIYIDIYTESALLQVFGTISKENA